MLCGRLFRNSTNCTIQGTVTRMRRTLLRLSTCESTVEDEPGRVFRERRRTRQAPGRSLLVTPTLAENGSNHVACSAGLLDHQEEFTMVRASSKITTRPPLCLKARRTWSILVLYESRFREILL